jgi:hypothetical protein
MIGITVERRYGSIMASNIGGPFRYGKVRRPGRPPTVRDGLRADPIPQQRERDPTALTGYRFAVGVEGSDEVVLPHRSHEMGWNPQADVPATTATLQILGAAHRWLLSPGPR